MRTLIRLATAACLLGSPLFPQGGGGVQFRDYKASTATSRPRTSCAGLVALTGYEFSVYSAAIIPAAANAPEHCREIQSPGSMQHKSTCLFVADFPSWKKCR